MTKLLAVIKREYIQRVRTKFFVIATILGPVLMAGFAVVPALMFGIKAGGPTRLAIIDQTGRRQNKNTTPEKPTEPQVRTNDPKEQANQSGQMFQGSYVLEEIKLDDRPL